MGKKSSLNSKYLDTSSSKLLMTNISNENVMQDDKGNSNLSIQITDQKKNLFLQSGIQILDKETKSVQKDDKFAKSSSRVT